MKTFLRNGKPSENAFSLVEVTLAIGIVSFAVLSILGTLSVGLATIKDAKKDVTHAEIMSQVSTTIFQSPFDQLETYASKSPFFFDQAGRQLDSSSNALYSASLSVSAGDSTTYPGAESTTNSAKTVQIAVSTVVPGTTNVISSSHGAFLVPKT